MVWNRKAEAIVIGIDNYKRDPLRWCVYDADQISEVLTMPEYGFNVVKLMDNEATTQRLLEKIDQAFSSEADIILFYLSGHGWKTPYGVFLATHDCKPLQEGLDLDFLRRVVQTRSRQGRAIVLILDCCHSGAASIKDSNRQIVSARSADIASAIPVQKGSVVLAACREDQIASESFNLRHGVFTYYLLEGLLGGAADSQGEVTVTGLYDYASRILLRMLKQTPVFQGDISGRIILGNGFSPIHREPFEEEVAIEIERDAETHLSTYQSQVGQLLPNRDYWKNQGYKMASQSLEPIVRWFESKSRVHPELTIRPSFQSSVEAAYGWQARLSEIEVGYILAEGTVEGNLGSGTFGTVWKVRPGEVDKPPLAYKVYHGQELNIKDKVLRFERGYEAMRQLDHPHIVSVGLLTKCPLGFYMDFIDGPNFRNFVGTLDEAGLLSILLTVAETLKHAHDRGVVHRDVKPENIILRLENSRWHPYLTDFDLAWFSTATQITKEAIGTAFYGAPEQTYKPGSASARAPTVDVFSFGQLCFYAATNSDPIPQVSDNVRALRGQLGKWYVEEAARDFLQLYEDCTRSEPKDRVSDFREICDRLFQIQQMLGETGPDIEISSDRLIREIVFSLAGLPDKGQSDYNSFVSLSGRTLVELNIKSLSSSEATLEFRFQPREELAMEGVDHRKARVILNTRIDESLKEYSDVQRRSGKYGIYEVFVDVRRIPLSLKGVQKCRQIVSRVIDAIERC